MSSTGKVIIGIVILFVAVWLIGQVFAATIGYVVLATIAAVIVGLVVALIRANVRAHADPRTVLTDNADKIAERKLKVAERKITRERLKH